jgi:predicted acylesterase/phospholipase RssA/CRP-like cAMP-binding protein
MSEVPFPERWRTALRASDLFGPLEDTTLAQLGFQEREVDAGATLVHQGEDAKELFVILEGELEITLPANGAVLRRVGPGGVIGEVSLALGGKRTASASAVAFTRVLALSQPDFERVLADHPSMSAPLTRLVAERTRRGKAAGFLRELFGDLQPDEIDAIERQVNWVHLPSGRELVRAGGAPEMAYLVVVGRLRAAGSDDTASGIDEFGPGQWVGEMAVLTGVPHGSTIYAVRDTELLGLSQPVFESLIADHPRAMRETTRAFAGRVQARLAGAVATRAKTKTIAVLPASPSVDLAPFVHELVATLSSWDKTIHLTAKTVDELLNKPGISSVAVDEPAHLRLASWLLEQEDRHGFVVYEAGSEWSEWTERSIRNADHILTVTNGSGATALSEVERRLATQFEVGRAPRQSLVLLQAGSGDRFPGTARFLAPRNVDGHFHVRRGVRGDVARVARLLTERSVCVVLGGGGSRGYAHLGLLRAMRELSIPVDAIGGTSVGAVIAVAHGVGSSVEEIMRVLPPGLTRSFTNVTLPVVSLLSAKVTMEVLHELVGTLDLEDLATPVFCVSTNLTRGGEVVHRRGSIAMAVRASTAIPGMFPPVPWNDELLVDGGIANNIPVDTMAALYQGSVIALDVMPEVGLQASDDLSPSLSGWTAARRRFNPFDQGKKQPDILDILFRSATAASKSIERAERSARAAALYLRPTISRWNIADFKNAAPVVEEGYAGTVNQLRTWWAANRQRITGTP